VLVHFSFLYPTCTFGSGNKSVDANFTSFKRRANEL